MNNKQKELLRTLEIVTDCCNMDIGDEKTFTSDDVLGRSRTSNLVMTRCILAYMIVIVEGYSPETCARLMNRTENAVRHLLDIGHDYDITSKAYRIAKAETLLRCRDEIK